jgi:RNA polymerase sigma-70 factor (ECF subfamily)
VPNESKIQDEQATTRLVSRAVKRAQAGDREALGFLYVHYADNIYGYVRSIVHDHHEAEDVTQHIFAKLIHVIGSYQERDVPFFAWMLRVARNAAVDHIRQRRLVPVEEVRTAQASVGDSPRAGRIDDLKDALATLPQAQREVLILRHFAGLSPPEIAVRTGRTEGSIHGLHHRGRRALSAELISRDAAPATAPSLVARSARMTLTLLALLCGCCGLAGCGVAAVQGEHAARLRAPRARSALVASERSAAATTSSPDFFASTSFWNQPSAPEAPLDPQSAEMVAGLDREVAREQAERRGPWINTTSYGVPIVTVPANQPTVTVQLDHAPDAALSSAWSAVPLPAQAEAAYGSDGYMVVSQPSTDQMWEFWRLNRQSDGWHASWGGAIQHASTNPGVYGPEAWPGAKPWWGATASSLALAGGTMTIAELRQGQIDHALAIALPEVRAGVFASPAQRTDGRSPNPLALPEGARLRLDPQLDLASLNMPPPVRTIAVAAQRYGILVRDFSANIAFIAEDPTSTGSNPYTGPSGLFEGKYPSQLLASFPWSHLQVLQLDLRSQGSLTP